MRFSKTNHGCLFLKVGTQYSLITIVAPEPGAGLRLQFYCLCHSFGTMRPSFCHCHGGQIALFLDANVVACLDDSKSVIMRSDSGACSSCQGRLLTVPMPNLCPQHGRASRSHYGFKIHKPHLPRPEVAALWRRLANLRLRERASEHQIVCMVSACATPFLSSRDRALPCVDGVAVCLRKAG